MVGYPDIIELLLDKGADPNAVTDTDCGKCPLYLAAEDLRDGMVVEGKRTPDYLGCCRVLLDNGAEVNKV